MTCNSLSLSFANLFAPFFSQATEEQIKLMEFQEKLEEKHKKTFQDQSLSDTIYKVKEA